MNHMNHPERNRLARKGLALLCALVAIVFLAPFLLVASGVDMGSRPRPGRFHERGPCICLPHTPNNPF
jgi:hypothetical protein